MPGLAKTSGLADVGAAGGCSVCRAGVEASPEVQRRLMRCLSVFLCGLAVALLAVPVPSAGQTGFDRPGGDYTSVAERSGDPAACASRCDREPRCRAWSFVYPGAAGQNAVCWLKSQVPARTENACCVSGIKGAGVQEPRKGRDGALEFGIDRMGGDYRNFDTQPDPNG